MASSSKEDDLNKPVIGYPTSTPPADSVNSLTNCPTARYTPNHNTYVGHPPVDSDKLCRTIFLRRVTISLVSCLIIFGTLYFILSLVFRPIPPEFRVNTLTIPPGNITSLFGYPVWMMGLLVKNPNKMPISYDDMQAGIFLGEESLCQTTISRFIQPRNNEMSLKASFDDIEYSSFNFINVGRAQGRIRLNVKISGWILFKAGAWRTRYQLMNVFCKDLIIIFNSTTASGHYRAHETMKCQVYVYR